jgi:hypothetical protein
MMATIFRDKDSRLILRIDLGDPDSEIYAEKEGLINWESEIVDEKVATDLALVTFPDPPPVPVIDQKEIFKKATADEKIQILAKKIGLI